MLIRVAEATAWVKSRNTRSGQRTGRTRTAFLFVKSSATRSVLKSPLSRVEAHRHRDHTCPADGLNREFKRNADTRGCSPGRRLRQLRHPQPLPRRLRDARLCGAGSSIWCSGRSDGFVPIASFLRDRQSVGLNVLHHPGVTPMLLSRREFHAKLIGSAITFSLVETFGRKWAVRRRRQAHHRSGSSNWPR